MNVVIAGASGLVGRALVATLTQQGHDVMRLVRRPPEMSDELPWDPARRRLETRILDGVDAVVNLAGENIGGGRWTTARRERIRGSRINATATLVMAMTRCAQPPRVLINASAVGFYGDRGDEVLTERSAHGRGFLAETCGEWEAEAAHAADFGVRTVLARFGMILAAEGGALKRMLPLFRAGMGGRLGSGRQWISWIHRDDVTDVLSRALVDETIYGPVNVVAPTPVTNAEFTLQLSQAVNRPAFLNAPAFALRVALGRIADEALLSSVRAIPERLRQIAHVFRYPTLAVALRDAVRRG